MSLFSDHSSVRLAAVTAVAAAGLIVSGCALPDEIRTDVSWSSTAIDGHSIVEDAPVTSASPSPVEPTTSIEPATPTTGPASNALATLETIPVKGRAPKTGYTRSQFGKGWIDDVDVEGGHNGCDTRNDILRRDLIDLTTKPKTRDCVILTGILDDVYTGKVIDFQRGETTSNAVQIDHVVALSDAWQKGAQQLTADERKSFANDPLNLQAVDGPTNARKKDGDAATWLPPNRAYRCTYVSRQIEVKASYRLWVTKAEKEAMQRVLAAC